MADKEFKVRIFCSPNSKQPIRNKHRPFFDILAWTFSSGQIELNSECINPGESQIGMVSFVAPELLEGNYRCDTKYFFYNDFNEPFLGYIVFLNEG
ncbi:MAG: hypothetical protein IPP27_15885 [Bacteroidetes bacterium]|nr:hypothetical protein [Bacteroidota bacterium]MBK9415537.1 hypothetical protein [Bacteroidota bacterium]MBL0033570.1 hypothetical protein [Bacteroidota bacterium]MBP6426776.1 hypothetical protein [Bacteroidia bacterium]MBP6656404.1 hypothetical protein [Bacteroidia bacterium]